MKTKRILLALALMVGGFAQIARAEQALKVSALNQDIKAAGANWVAKETWISRLSTSEAQHMFGLAQKLAPDVEFVNTNPRAKAAGPVALDWRNNGGNWISPLLNQANCGSCVAFASIGVMESQMRIASGLSNFNISLSPQNLFACGGGACEQGWMPDEAAQFLQTKGVVDEACQPYTSGATGEDVACSATCADSAKRTYRIANYATPTQYMKDIEAVKAALQKGPLVTTLTVYADFMSYSSGVYKHVKGSALGGHAVSIIGYDDTTQSFIIRNSWGPEWGEGGFAHISYSDVSGVGNQTWSYEMPATAGSISIQSPRDYTYVSNVLPFKAFANFSNTDSMSLTIFDASEKPVWSGSCAANCEQTLDISKLADGQYEIEITAMDKTGQSLGTSPHQAFFVANQKPILALSFTGKAVDLSTALKNRIEFTITSKSSSVPLSSVEFHYKDGKGNEVVKTATKVLWNMSMGWRTNLVPNGAYEIWMVGHVLTNQFDVVTSTPHMTVNTLN
jgi:C1A family cysteine protease